MRRMDASPRMWVWLHLAGGQELSPPQRLSCPISHGAPSRRGGSFALIWACFMLTPCLWLPLAPRSGADRTTPRERGSLRLPTCSWELDCCPETVTG